MQDKPDSPIGQSSSPRTKRASEPAKAGSSGSSSSASMTPGAPSPKADVGAQSTGVIDQAKETISNVASQAGDKVTSRLDSQKDRAADGLGSVVQALRQTGDQLREQNQATAVHEYISSAADQVERFADYLRSTNVSQMVNKAEQFARRQPALFLGGAFVLGLLGARFLKSSGQAGSSQSGSVPRNESLVPRGGYTGSPSYGQSYPGSGGTSGAGYGSPLDVPPVRRREDF
jgi:hypothetical protein